jgi:adenosylmethionine-8-amino-7-oxononanoate aminotransferase
MEILPPQPKRVNYIARHGSYHGTTFGALSVGGHVARREIFEPMLLQNCNKASTCNEYRGRKEGQSREEYVAQLAQELDDKFQKMGPETVIAFIAEPVVGAVSGSQTTYNRPVELTSPGVGLCSRSSGLFQSHESSV